VRHVRGGLVEQERCRANKISLAASRQHHQPRRAWCNERCARPTVRRYVREIETARHRSSWR